LSFSLLPLTAWAAAGAERAGGLVGWVEDTRGMPVAGAVISLFGKGLGGSGLVTLSDSAGRFFVRALPPGSYTLRALSQGLRPAPAREVTVIPDQDAIFSVSLAPLGDLDENEAAERERELAWLFRHRRRSVLEDTVPALPAQNPDQAPATADLLGRAPWLSSMAGSVEIVANPASLAADGIASEGLPGHFGVVRLGGRVAHLGRFSLGGLVAESENAAWRMATEFVADPEGGHELRVGAGYGSRLLRPVLARGDGHADNRGVGAIFVQDRWTAGKLTATFGGRYSFIGYLADPNHVDPSAAVEWRQKDGTTLRLSATRRTLVPGGDLLTLSTLSSGASIALAMMDPELRPERIGRFELGTDHSFGAASLGAHAFYEDVRNPLVNSFEGVRAPRSLHIANGHAVAARGLGFSLGRRFGNAVNGSVTYTYGRSFHETADAGALPAGEFHDVVTRVETFVERSGTRVLVLYRVNALNPEAEGVSQVTNSRFDVQLRQDLPFLGGLTRADWELLLAYRNLFYEPSEGAAFDELVVSNPPKRMLGGITVRF
jgi:hypothetical protein